MELWGEGNRNVFVVNCGDDYEYIRLSKLTVGGWRDGWAVRVTTAVPESLSPPC